MPEEEDRNMSFPREDGDIEPATVGPYVLHVEEDRLVVRESWGEYAVGWVLSLVAGPLFALGTGALILSEIREPGGRGRDLVLFLFQLNPAGWPLKLRSIGVSWLMILLFGLISLVLLRTLYRNVVHGRQPWVFDREEGFLRLGAKPVRPLLGIDTVSIERERGRGGFVYRVRLMPESLASATSGVFGGPHDDVFSFGSRKDAREFAEAIAGFLGVKIVKDFD